MKVSVIIPCYNAEDYINACLESVQKQTYSDLEVVVVNDGSIDRTKEILSEWNRNSSLPIKIINTENNGAAAARNIGLKESEGEYIQFLDVDDILLPEKIAHQVLLIKNQSLKPDIIAAAYNRRIIGYSLTQKFVDKRGHWFGLLASKLGRTSSNLFKKTSLMEIDGFDETLKSSQEYDLMFRLIRSGHNNVLVDDKILTIKRDINPDAISAIHVEGNIKRYIHLRKKIIAYLESKDLLTDDLVDAFHQTIFNAIKRLYRVNREKSIRLHDDLIPDGFVPEISGAISKRYRNSYMLLGFYLTQWLYNFKTEKLEAFNN